MRESDKWTLLALPTTPPTTETPDASRTPQNSALAPGETGSGAAVLRRVQAARRQGAPIASEAEAYAVSRLTAKALAEISGCLEALDLAEQALCEQNRALEAALLATREEHLRYQCLLRTLPDAVLATDAEDVIREANPAAVQMLGLSGRYLVGKPVTKCMRPGDLAALPSVLSWSSAASVQQCQALIKTSAGLAPVTIAVSAIFNLLGYNSPKLASSPYLS